MPEILVLDDHPDQLDPIARNFGGRVLHPQDVDENDFAGVDLIVVDFVLEDWPERDEGNTPLLKPMDGRALIEVIRSQLAPSAGPVGFVLTTAEPDKLARGLTTEKRESVLARLNNLEWMIPKDTPPADFSAQVAAFAAAIQSLPKSWPESSGPEMKEVVSQMLALERTEPWAEVGWESIFECHPPIHDVSVSSQGLAFVRWLAHRIIPYPTFLMDDLHLATRLGLTVQSLQKGLEQSKEFRAAFEPVRYQGILGDLAGRRWWRTAVEYLLWEWTEGNPFSRDVVSAAISAQTSTDVESLPMSDGVVCLDAELRSSSVCPEADAVRVQPDDWPAFAQPAWASISLLDSGDAPHLRSLVLPLDEPRLASGE